MAALLGGETPFPMYGNKNEKPITVITRDNIRKLRPHVDSESAEERSNRHAVVLSMSELERIQGASHYMSKEDLERRSKDVNEYRTSAAEVARLRKQKLEEYDHKRTANAKLNDLQREAKDRSNYLLAKAQMQLEEQEDEIKHMNELMLYAKCVSIRDTQVQEKKWIQKERKEEEARLDTMMEQERVNELKKLEERERKRVEELRKGAAKIRQQIEERREAALLEQERRDQETKQILKTIADTAEQEKQEKLSKIRSQRLLMQEVAKANQESLEHKRREKLREEEEDRKILQYIIEKEQRDIENDKLQAQKKAEREQELARLRAAQEKMSDKQAQQDALRAQRAFEAYEREWRRKEKEAAEKQAQQESELRQERYKQQRSREHAIAIEAHKMKQEFFENLERQKEVEAKLKREEEARGHKNKLYAMEVKAQIKEKEEIRRKSRDEFFLEGIRLAHERLDKKTKIDQIKSRKLSELRGMGVPEKYCSEIERQVRTTSKHFFSMGAKSS
ncbi:tumor suppressor, Mitostatin-domain-containing protein [Entophlyctis helioformis]|nr:tumor suppressor, Mitostatin-domain-containing protein [Entophlyctis helioformis]